MYNSYVSQKKIQPVMAIPVLLQWMANLTCSRILAFCIPLDA